MALEDILRKIRAEAEAEAEAVLRGAQGERDRMLEEANGRAKAAAERILSAGRARAEEAKRKELATASVEVRRIVLEAKQKVLDDVFEQALNRLAGLPDAQYRELLAGFAADGAASGKEEIVVSRRDRERLGEDFPDLVSRRLRETRNLPGELRFSPRARPLRGGLILSAGDIELNMSFERTLASLRESLEPQVASLLFQEASPEAPR